MAFQREADRSADGAGERHASEGGGTEGAVGGGSVRTAEMLVSDGQKCSKKTIALKRK